MLCVVIFNQGLKMLVGKTFLLYQNQRGNLVMNFSNEQVMELSKKLMAAETQEEVKSILISYKLWNDKKAWRYYGDIENNYSSIGNQQSDADASIVEKIINSHDAILINACKEGGVNPESITDHLYGFKLINEQILMKNSYKNGIEYLNELTKDEKELLSNKVAVSLTGLKSPNNPSITISDRGEGQTPDETPNTILSLSKSNKLKICFVQGKFNMGGSGALKFAGENGLQLVITRKNPNILDKNASKRDFEWGITIIRRERPVGNMRSSVYKYLAPINSDIIPTKGDILSFFSEKLNIMPNSKTAYGTEVEYGTLIKLYEYNIGSYKTSALIDNGIGDRIRMLIPNMTIPMRICEFRNFNFTGSKNIYLTGIVDYINNREEVLETNFPSHGDIVIEGEKIKYSIYAFKERKMDKTLRGIGVLYTLNGQAQGKLENRIFSKDKVKLDVIKKDLLVVVDCSLMTNEGLEQIFMNSRDRFVESKLKKQMDKELESILANHDGLRNLNETRRKVLIQDKLKDNKPLADTLSKLVKSNPILKSLFSAGEEIEKQSRGIGKNSGGFVGAKFPTYFKFVDNEYGILYQKDCAKNRSLRVFLETDAENNYFKRINDSGKYSLYLCENGKHILYGDYSLNLFNGIATLNIILPKGAKVNDNYNFILEVGNNKNQDLFTNELIVNVKNDAKKTVTFGSRRKVNRNSNGNDKVNSNKGLSLPQIIKVKEGEWIKHGFNSTSAIKVIGPTEEGYIFFINVDNKYLLNECKYSYNNADVIQSQFIYGITLLGLSLLNLKNNKDNKNKIDENVIGDFNEYISMICESWAPFIIPMLRFLNEVENIAA